MHNIMAGTVYIVTRLWYICKMYHTGVLLNSTPFHIIDLFQTKLIAFESVSWPNKLQ